MTEADEGPLLIAIETFLSRRRGKDKWVNTGDIAEAGSWPVEVRPAAFRPLLVRWTAPGSRKMKADAASPAAVSPASLKHRGGGHARPEKP